MLKAGIISTGLVGCFASTLVESAPSEEVVQLEEELEAFLPVASIGSCYSKKEPTNVNVGSEADSRAKCEALCGNLSLDSLECFGFSYDLGSGSCLMFTSTVSFTKTVTEGEYANHDGCKASSVASIKSNPSSGDTKKIQNMYRKAVGVYFQDDEQHTDCIASGMSKLQVQEVPGGFVYDSSVTVKCKLDYIECQNVRALERFGCEKESCDEFSSIEPFCVHKQTEGGRQCNKENKEECLATQGNNCQFEDGVCSEIPVYTRTGDSCEFPFTFNGKTHYECTLEDTDLPGRSWCKTNEGSVEFDYCRNTSELKCFNKGVTVEDEEYLEDFKCECQLGSSGFLCDEVELCDAGVEAIENFGCVCASDNGQFDEVLCSKGGQCNPAAEDKRSACGPNGTYNAGEIKTLNANEEQATEEGWESAPKPKVTDDTLTIEPTKDSVVTTPTYNGQHTCTKPRFPLPPTSPPLPDMFFFGETTVYSCPEGQFGAVIIGCKAKQKFYTAAIACESCGSMPCFFWVYFWPIVGVVAFVIFLLAALLVVWCLRKPAPSMKE